MTWQNKAPELVFAYARVSSADQNPERQTELFMDILTQHMPT